MGNINNFLNSNLNEILVAVLLAAFYILLGLDDDVLSKQYIKKYNIMLYLVFVLLLFVFEVPLAIIYAFFFTVLVFSTLSVYELADNLEKQLSWFQLFLYSLKLWISYTKYHLFFFFSCIIIRVNHYLDYATVAIGLTVVAIFIHWIFNAHDSFAFFQFEHLDKKLNNNLKKYKSDHSKNNSLILDDSNKHIMAFLVFIEDKDFFTRPGLTFSPWAILIRKLKSIGCNNVAKYTRRVIKSKFRRINKNPIHRLAKMFKRYFRGYSTVPMQVVRRTVIKSNYSYNNKLKRKILIEYIYTHYYQKAKINVLKRKNKKEYFPDKKTYKGELNSTLKMVILLYHYVVIKNEPTNIDDLLKDNDSRLSSAAYKAKWDEFDYVKDDYIKQVEAALCVFNRVNYL